jgi:hypothetical protein
MCWVLAWVSRCWRRPFFHMPALRLAVREIDSPRSRSGSFNRLAEGDLVGAFHDGDAVGNERVAQHVPRPRDAEGLREGGDFAVLAAGGEEAAAAQRSQPRGEIVADGDDAAGRIGGIGQIGRMGR